MKCLCKNGQNGDPAWKKSCSWSFNDAPWSLSDVKSVQCKRRTGSSESQSDIESTTQSMAQSTTRSTTSTSTTATSTTPELNSYTFFITTRVKTAFGRQDGWLSQTPFGQISKSENTVEISKLCNPDFINSFGMGCKEHRCRGNLFKLLASGVQNKDGLWETNLNCPNCGCENDEPMNINELFGK